MKRIKEKLLPELVFKAIPGGGPGGQHANKTSTKVTLLWDIKKTEIFSDKEQRRILKNLKTYFNKDKQLRLSSSATRSQLANKEEVTQRFFKLIQKALRVPKERKKSRPGKKYHEKRLKEKRRIAEKKQRRKKQDY